MMTNGDHEERIFLSHPHTINGFIFLPTIKCRILCLKRFTENPEYAEMRHDMMTSLNITMASLDDHMRESQYNQCTASRDSLGKITWVMQNFQSQD